MNFKAEISKLIAKEANLGIEEVKQYMEVPPNADMGDFSFPCFRLGQLYKKSPAQVAIDMQKEIAIPEFLEKIEAKGPYLNFFVDRPYFAGVVVSEVFGKKSEYGSTDIGHGQCVVMDYSSPNIGKPFHVGHLRSTVIGRALYNIFGFLGYKPFSINYLGDWGTQFGTIITAYKRWGNEAEVLEGGVFAINKLYRKFHEETQANEEIKEELKEEARSWLVKMEQGDEYALKLWRWFCDISLKDYKELYTRLKVDFDSYNGESFYNDKMTPIVEELKDKKILKEDDGAMIVDLEHYNMPPCLILRRDGGTLYPTRDIASVMYRKKEYDFVKAIYVTGNEQVLHFAQWFKVVELMGYDWAKDQLAHVPFGLMRFSGGKLSTRQGNVLLMKDLINEAVAKIKEIIEQKNPQLANKDEVAEQVGIGAVIFNDLYNSRIKDVEFSWEKMLNFEGETGPYVQYTAARCASVIKKSDVGYADADPKKLTNDDEFELVKALYTFPEKIIEAANKYEPFIISRHVMHVAQSYNKFYHNNIILKADGDIKKARLMLTECTLNVISTGLGLLGIDTPAQM